MRFIHIVILSALFSLYAVFGQSFPVVKPQEAGFIPDMTFKLNTCINDAIERGETPGAVLLVMRNGKIVHRMAYGYAEVKPQKIKMTIETIFDLASLTKPMATATATMMLVEQGKIRLMDRVDQFIPEFQPWIGEDGKKIHIRLWHLLTHTSGLPPYAPVNDLVARFGAPNPDSTLAYIALVKRNTKPATHFKYSCLNFITLQRVVELVSGMDLDQFTHQYIFVPLKMNNTTFKPSAGCAATELIDGVPLVGTVHDPLARILMGGISGNAGLFSTADDMSRFAQMMLNHGSLDGVRILSPLTVRMMTSVPEKVHFSGRALGWDVDSDYSTNGGDLFPYGSYGHTGYTGTSMWIDPETRTVVILLTNRVHPDDTASVIRLRSLVANIVAASITDL
jgi:CubicO group peptidase (beta-lactamase class C family)